MRVRSWKRYIAIALVACGAWAPAMLQADPLNTNLLVDPGFENVTGAYNLEELNSWSDGTKTGFAYASGTFDNNGPLAGGGDRYFTSNRSSDGDVTGPGQVAQLFGVSTTDTGAAIAAGTATYSFGAFFSTFSTHRDFGSIHVEFLDELNNSLGTDQVDAPAAGLATWTEFSGGGAVPVGTVSVRFSVFGAGLDGGPDGYIDNAYFVISSTAIPEPSSTILVGLGLAGLTLIRRKLK